MAYFRFSRLADADLLRIATYTLETWGKNQTEKYLRELETYCQKLADHPLLGHTCDEILPDLRQLTYESHVIFYREKEYGVFVSRILHQRMLPENQEFGENIKD
jgi:toxin ParE1/3/4